ILGFRADIRKWQALVFIVFRAGWSIPFVALGTIEILIEIEKSQQLVLSFEPGVLAIQSNKITGGAVSLFLDEANVVLLLELEQHWLHPMLFCFWNSSISSSAFSNSFSVWMSCSVMPVV